jgi:hypothetical protein
MEQRRIEIVNTLLSEIEAHIPNKEIRNRAVSNSDIGWQLDHSLKVFNAVSIWIANSKPEDYKRNFNVWRLILFPLCYIPRGKAKAPKIVRPPEVIKQEDLISQLQTARTHIVKLKTLPKKAYFKHYIFGMLSKKQTLRFLEMHTKHHLKIINDILNQ